MSLLGLVDYGSSDESDNDDSQEGNKITTNSINAGCNDNSTNIINTKLENATINVDKVLENTPVLTEKKSRLESQQDEDDAPRPSESIFSSLLPPPKDDLFSNSILEEEEDVPKIVNKFPIEKPPGKKRGPAQISIPSLSDFDDLDEEKDKKMKPKPSEKLCGVLSILPPPKEELISTAKLIPHTLTKKVVKNTLTPTQIKHQAKNRVLEKTKVNSNKINSKPMLDSDSEDENDKKDSKEGKSIDFFSLSEPINIPLSDEIVASNMLPLEGMRNSVETASSSNINDEDTEITEDGKKLISTVMNLPKDEIIQKNKAEVGPKLPVPEQEFNVDTEGNVAFDDKAIEYLCGKRGVKRKNELINEADIIDINGEDIKPDEREWLVKALTEEPIQRPISLRVTAGGQSKKKHQITYLAEQAKAMELELKNQWASNKLARRQAQSKYGF